MHPSLVLDILITVLLKSASAHIRGSTEAAREGQSSKKVHQSVEQWQYNGSARMFRLHIMGDL